MRILYPTLAKMCFLFCLCHSSSVFSVSINFSGQIDVILEDSGGAIYSGSPIGTNFSGTIDDVTGSGEITDGTTVTAFSCCQLDAESPDISDNHVLSADEAELLNAVAGFDLFSANDVIDSVNLEGDSMTSSGGRIEVGLSYILDPNTFSDEQTANYSLDSDDSLLTLFFILEEGSGGNTDLYDAIGAATASSEVTSDIDMNPDASSIPGQLLARDLDGDDTTVEAYYDPALGITWLKNTNLASTEKFSVPNIDADGRMDFPTAQMWINTMNSVSYLGQVGWRMPTLTPVAGGNVYNNSYTNNATSDVGNAVTGVGWVDAAGLPASEMGHLFYVTLGNIGRYTPNAEGSPITQIEQQGWEQLEEGPFQIANMENVVTHWAGLDNVSTVFDAPTGWYFIFPFGSQSVGLNTLSRSVWPVHDGDIGTSMSSDSNESGGGVPSIWLLIIGVFGLYYRRIVSKAAKT